MVLKEERKLSPNPTHELLADIGEGTDSPFNVQHHQLQRRSEKKKKKEKEKKGRRFYYHTSLS
jgi:hypothetical protein